MIDPRIRKAGFIVLGLLVVAPIASAMWDHWIDGTQQDMIDNQIQFQAHHEGRTQNQNTARVEQVAGEHCQALMRSGDCEEPRRRSDV